MKEPSHHGKVALKTMEIGMVLVKYDSNCAKKLKAEMSKKPGAQISIIRNQCRQEAVPSGSKHFEFEVSI
jgi:hypothetical protein